jgi:serine/threonine-protein kinase RsbW
VSRIFSADYEATVQSVALVRNQMAALARDCGLGEEAVSDVKLAVSEAATNALLHGYRSAGGTIGVEVVIDDGDLEIAIRDSGGGMRPRSDSPGLGLGLPVIASVAKRLEINDDGPGTRLRMTFDCPAAGPGAAAVL